MDTEHSEDYDKLKEAVLKKYDVNRDSYRQRFRALVTPADESPQDVIL